MAEQATPLTSSKCSPADYLDIWHKRRRIWGCHISHTEYFADGDSYRRFVESLNPAYHPKYVALPRILKTPRILRDIAGLVGRAD
jgi:lysylphosphatidylglycerol synthetase-like protein (DUF2156 family)